MNLFRRRRRPQTNPYEAQNRTAKAVKIATAIERNCGPATDWPRLLELLPLAPSDFIEDVCAMARVPIASAATWAEMVGYLRERYAYNLTQRRLRGIV